MRHIRDPVTGRCLVCEKGAPGVAHAHTQGSPPGNSPHPGGQPSWDDVKKKVIYVNAFKTPNRAPGHNQSNPKAGPKHPGDGVYLHNSKTQPVVTPRDVDVDSGVTSGSRGSVISASKVHPSYHAGTGGPGLVATGHGYDPHYVHGGYGREYSPPRSPYPHRNLDRENSPPRNAGWDRIRDRYGNTGRTEHRVQRHDPEYGTGAPRGKQHNAAFHDGARYEGASWGRRRCCTVLWAVLILLLLVALAVGLYFLITYLMAQEAANLPDVRLADRGGSYVDGVYVVPLTRRPPQTYLVLGADTPCNAFNNNTIGNETLPNCADVTTALVPSNYTASTLVPTVKVVVQPAAAGARTTPDFISVLSSFLISVCFTYRLYSIPRLSAMI